MQSHSHLLRRAVNGAAVSGLLALSFAVPALAATDFYFNGGSIAYTEEVYDTIAHRLTLSYGHNLSTGGTMCAGAHEYAGYSCQARPRAILTKGHTTYARAYSASPEES